MDYRPVKTVPYFPAKILSRVEMLYSFEWMKTGFQTDFVTVLDTSKRACTIKDITVLFLRKRAKWFQKLNL